jgi:hypothetical protein
MGLKSLLGKTKLDKLLLLHELRVWTIIYDIATKDRRCQWTVDFFGVCVLNSTVENKVIAVNTKTGNDFSTEEDKGEDITVLGKKSVRVLSHKEDVGITFSRHFIKKP